MRGDTNFKGSDSSGLSVHFYSVAIAQIKYIGHSLWSVQLYAVTTQADRHTTTYPGSLLLGKAKTQRRYIYISFVAKSFKKCDNKKVPCGSR